MPSVTAIAQETNLSRQTVNKHLKEFDFRNEDKAQIKKFSVLQENVLTQLYKLAMSGDIRACKYFLQFSGHSSFNNVGTYIDKQQNNYH